MATSKAYARESPRHGIRVNVVAPGPVAGTKLLGNFYEGEAGGKIASRYLTGQMLSVDGGLTIIG